MTTSNGTRPQGNDDALTMRLTIDGHRHEFRLGDYNALEARLFRQEIGMSLQRVFRSGDVDIDVIAALWWLQVRRTKPQTTYDDIAADFTYDTLRQSNAADTDDDEQDDGQVVDPELSAGG